MRFLILFIFSLASCNNKSDVGRKRSNDTITITVPVSKDSTKDLNFIDSTYLTIKINADTLVAEFWGHSLRLDNETSLDQFIQDNKKNINPRRIRIVTTQHYSYQKFKSTVEVLKKNEYYGFQMMTQ